MIRRITLFALGALIALSLALPASAAAAGEECELTPRMRCYGLEAVSAGLSTTQAGAHPDLTLGFAIKSDPKSKESAFGSAFAPTRNVRIEVPPGLSGDPNVVGPGQQCKVQELVSALSGGGCPNGSQVGTTAIVFTGEAQNTREPIYMMQPPGGNVVAQLGFIAGAVPIFVNAKVRSEHQDDYGLTFEIVDAATTVKLMKSASTTWGVPADPSHDTERCSPQEAIQGCVFSERRPPGSPPRPFMINPTRCGVSLFLTVSASSWPEPQRFDSKSTPFPEITGCDRLPFGPSLTLEPTSHRAGAPTGAEVTIKLPASEGVEVLEPSQMRDLRVKLPVGMAFNPGAADGAATCSALQVGLGGNEASHCPAASKLADTEFDIPILERRLKGAVYLREPEPGNLFRLWITADDLGLHVKQPGQLEVDQATGQITSVTLGIPQAPIREVKLDFKSGFRAPLLNPPTCDDYRAEYEFVPWSGGPPVRSSAPMTIDEGCGGGGFSPKLSAGSTASVAGEHSPFLFTLSREDGEQNPASLDLTLPKGLAATLAGVSRCEGAAAEAGACSSASRIGKVVAAVGAGPAPLWVPQPDKRPTAVYLGGPYKGAPLSAIAVVPAQAGPFDLGDEVVRSAIYLDPATAQATVKSDPLPQIIEGIPIPYRTVQVQLDRPGFALNPTSCKPSETTATVTSIQGAVAHPSSPFTVTNCAKLGFKPRLGLRLIGGTHRGAHPALRAVLRPRAGDANLAETVVLLPHSAFLDQAHIRTVCTRVQYAAKQCPAGSIYGHVTAFSPLLDEPLQGPVYLRSSSHQLPDLVFALHGLVDVEAVGRVDSVNGAIRASFEAIPDAPLSKVVLNMQGAKKGLIVNSTNLCASVNRASAEFSGQNGKAATLHPALQVSCKGRGKGRRR